MMEEEITQYRHEFTILVTRAFYFDRDRVYYVLTVCPFTEVSATTVISKR